jgi:glycosyltransferase involved in cell wall biosynthesis
MIKNLSVFFPCYNEAENLPTTIEKAIKVLEKLDLTYEILIINDGSKDNTKEVAEQLAGNNSKIVVINHPKNLGYGEAVKSGFYKAKYDYIVYNDGDGQFDFSEVTKFIEKIEDYDLLIGYRIKRKDSALRILFKEGWRLSQLIFFGLTLRDVDCGFKMVKRQVLEKIPKLQSTRGGMVNAELAVKTKKFGFKVGEIGVHHYPRKFGKPTGANMNVILQSYLDLLKIWWKLLNKLQFGIIVGILLLTAFLRFYNIEGYMSFLGDEGRDALVVKKILVEHDFPLLGPGTSIGNMYLGPLYYYMMSVPMAIFWLNPVAAAGMVTILAIFTVGLIYYLGSRWFGFWAGALSAYLYAISPVNIIYGRSSWNPNPAPFFALLSILGLYKVHKTGNFRWFILTGVALAFAAQMHYLALVLIPIVGVLWLYEVSLHVRGKLVKKHLVSGTLIAIVAFLFLMSPLLIFDLKYNFMNFHAVSTFFSNRETTVNVNPFNSLTRVIPIYTNNLIGRYMTGEILWLNWLLGVLVLFPIIAARRLWSNLALAVWLLLGLLGLSLYKQNVYDHYLGFLNPVPYLLLGYFVYLKKRWANVGLIILVLVLTGISIWKSPLKNPPNNQHQRTQAIAKFVIEESEGKPFNFALIAKSNYDSAYQFYLDMYGHKPKQVPFEITDQLFVVCEDSICDPVNNAKQEISHFGLSKIDKESEFMGVRVYKLIHNPTGAPPK